MKNGSLRNTGFSVNPTKWGKTWTTQAVFLASLEKDMQAKKLKTPKKPKRERISDLLQESSMSIEMFYNDALWPEKPMILDGARISVTGAASKFPSISNNRIQSVVFPKGGAKPRAVSFPAPAFSDILDTLSLLYQQELAKRGNLDLAVFNDDKKSRLFMLVLLSERCSRMDSHNITKAICDWVQQIGLVCNDKNLDALPLLKSQFALPDTDTSEILIVRKGFVNDLVGSLIQQILGAFHVQRPI